MRTQNLIFLFSAILAFIFTPARGQVAINIDGSAADTTTMLDVKSTNRGILIPRMSMSQIEWIGHPANGLLVYCTDDNNFFVNRGSSFTPDWSMVNSKWRANGPNIYYPGGNVGIGFNDPIAKLDVRGGSPDQPAVLMIGNSDLSHRLIISGGRQSDPDPFIQWKAGDALRFATDQGGGNEWMRVTGVGQVGIGTPAPQANLHVAETSLTYTGLFGTSVSTWNFGTNVSIGDDNWPCVLYIGQSATAKGYIIWSQDDTPEDAYMSVGTYGDVNPLILQEAGGKVGIGTLNPLSLLEVQYDPDNKVCLGAGSITANYIMHTETEANGDGNSALQATRSRDIRNDGFGYGIYQSNSAFQGYCAYGDLYSFGTTGFNYNDFTRCGGTFGSEESGAYWGSLGYKNSSGTGYGGYFSSYTSGSGKGSQSPQIGIGVGAWADLLGADIHGRIYGIYTEGEHYALFSNGTVYNDGLEIHLQDNGTETKTALYTHTSTDATVMTSGIAALSDGRAGILFDPAFRSSVSPDEPVVISVTPTGNSNGVFLSGVSGEGFTVVENNAGRSNVVIHYIAIGRRAGYEDIQLPQEVIDVSYTDKMARGLHNDADTKTDGEGLYYENGQLHTGRHLFTLPNMSKDAEKSRIESQERSLRRNADDRHKILTGKR